MDATLIAAVAAISPSLADLATRYPAYAANELYNKSDAADDSDSKRFAALADELLAISEGEQ